MACVSASILSADFASLGDDCRRVLKAGAQWLHFDVMDGHFVPNLTVGVPVLTSLSQAVEAVYDVHLMITDPLRYVDAFCRAGAQWLTFHLEADSDVEQTIAAIRAAGVHPGIVLKPATPAEAAFPYLDKVDMVLVMSVEPGFGGQSFLPDAPNKLRSLAQERARRGLSGLLLEVDGGVNAQTAPLCTAAGADVLVAGSAVFSAADVTKAVQALRNA